MNHNAKNVLGTDLKVCCTNPMTGFFRNGSCDTDDRDYGSHTVCARMTNAFLIFSKGMGNDLITPNPMYGFPGLKEGDQWCLCALRWLEAYHVGAAPLVDLEATHEKALDVIPIEYLQKRALKKT